MTNNRIIELAIKGLEAERGRIDEELAGLEKSTAHETLGYAASSKSCCKWCSIGTATTTWPNHSGRPETAFGTGEETVDNESKARQNDSLELRPRRHGSLTLRLA